MSHVPSWLKPNKAKVIKVPFSHNRPTSPAHKQQVLPVLKSHGSALDPDDVMGNPKPSLKAHA